MLYISSHKSLYYFKVLNEEVNVFKAYLDNHSERTFEFWVLNVLLDNGTFCIFYSEHTFEKGVRLSKQCFENIKGM